VKLETTTYRAACRAKWRADFVSKLGTTVEETDETLLWLERLEGAGIIPASKLEALEKETEELLRILSASLTTAKNR
jgi:four helix bundle protein